MLPIAALMASASAHEKWFRDPGPFPSDLGGALRPPALYYILAVVALVGALWACMAGAVELLIGLCIFFNIFPREVVVIAWIPVNMTLTIFNWVELVGHLPIYGIMALLLVWQSNRENTQRWVEGLQSPVAEE